MYKHGINTCFCLDLISKDGEGLVQERELK